MPLVVHYWAYLQSVHGMRCYGNIMQTRNFSEYMLVLGLCLVNVLVNNFPECLNARPSRAADSASFPRVGCRLRPG